MLDRKDHRCVPRSGILCRLEIFLTFGRGRWRWLRILTKEAAEKSGEEVREVCVSERKEPRIQPCGWGGVGL